MHAAGMSQRHCPASLTRLLSKHSDVLRHLFKYNVQVSILHQCHLQNRLREPA